MHFLNALPVSLLFATLSCDGARILGVFPNPEKSQFVLAEKLMIALTKRDHDVTVISPFAPVEAPRAYKTIYITKVAESK